MSDRCVLCDFPLNEASIPASDPLIEPRRLNCGHLFHIHCTKLALMPEFKCPACQLESPPGIEEMDPPVAKPDSDPSESQASEESESSYSAGGDNSSDEDYNSDSSSSSVSRSRIDLEASESYPESSSEEEKPAKRKSRKRDASPKKK